MAGGRSQPAIAPPYSLRQQPYQSIYLLSLCKTVLNRMVTCTARTPLPTLGTALSTFMLYRVPTNTFKPIQWTRTLIWTLQKYTYGQWIACNTFVHVATHSAARATHRLSLMPQITEVYNNSSSILIDKLSFTFGIPLTLQ
jgi:hypothetical protein